MREHDETKLPTLYSKRWTIRRKAALIEAIRRGGITLEQARRLYALIVEEIRSWERQLERHGLHGLRATRVQIYPRHKD